MSDVVIKREYSGDIDTPELIVTEQGIVAPVGYKIYSISKKVFNKYLEGIYSKSWLFPTLNLISHPVTSGDKIYYFVAPVNEDKKNLLQRIKDKNFNYSVFSIDTTVNKQLDLLRKILEVFLALSILSIWILVEVFV